MKSLAICSLSLTLAMPVFSLSLEEFNPDTARAYQAHIVAFKWPDRYSSEHIEYQNIENLFDVKRFDDSPTLDDASTATQPPTSQSQLQSGELLEESILPPESIQEFRDYISQIKRRANLLVDETETIIFKATGSKLELEFHSAPLYDGFAELTGKATIALGRYLQTDLSYKHYLFDSFTVPPRVENEATFAQVQIGATDSVAAPEPDENQPEAQPVLVKQFEPALVLDIQISNRTASGKLNYLDHPVIGTLIYFEPLELDYAVALIKQQQALASKAEIDIQALKEQPSKALAAPQF
ncbi:hypothetical protein FJM67_09595 [Maribrevibacterium harenarium]|uniref:Peptidoglycan-binding protein CsiV n=1 Tax=Maribrevibacterium harenarium TaxID=2589817 RepID=A0A501WZ25_9GAMM|nr:hypothetical protein [Maribrevibacterium harenarium]TPE51286.1 hypothetical protein FJM67_09595 [Maribrevibacterium harenarium]